MAAAGAATTPLKHVSCTPGRKFSARVTAASVTADVHSIPTLQQAAHAADVLVLAREHLHGVTFCPAVSRLHFHRNTYAALEGDIWSCKGMVDAKLLCNRYRDSGTLAQLAAASEAAGLQPAALRKAAQAQAGGGMAIAFGPERAQVAGDARQQAQQQAQQQPQQHVHHPQVEQPQRQQQGQQRPEPGHQARQQQRTTVREPVVPRQKQQEPNGQQRERRGQQQGRPPLQRRHERPVPPQQQQKAQHRDPEQRPAREPRPAGGGPAGGLEAAAGSGRGPDVWVRPCKGPFRREVMLFCSKAWEGLQQGTRASLIKANKEVVHCAADLARAWCAYRSGLPLRAARLRHPLSVYAHVAQRVQLRDSLEGLIDLLAQLRDDGILDRMAAAAAAMAGAAAAAAAGAGEPASPVAGAAAGGKADRATRSASRGSGKRGRGGSVEPGGKAGKRQKQDAEAEEEEAPVRRDEWQPGGQQLGWEAGRQKSRQPAGAFWEVPAQERPAAAADGRSKEPEIGGATKRRREEDVQKLSKKDRLREKRSKQQQQQQPIHPRQQQQPQPQRRHPQEQPQQPQQMQQQGEPSAPAAAVAAALPDSMPDGAGAWWALNRLLPLLQNHVPVTSEQRNAFALHIHSAGAEEQQGLYSVLRSCVMEGNTGGACKWVLSCIGN